MLLKAIAAIFMLLGSIGMTLGAERSHSDACATTCVDIFGGALPIPAGYRLQTDFGDTLRLVRIDRDPAKPYGNIYIGKVESLPSRRKRERSATDLGAKLESKSHGSLTIEVTTRTTKQLLVDKPVRYVSVLMYDNRHYVRITDSDPELWKQMIDQCARCGRQ